jgi:hypothetical protein
VLQPLDVVRRRQPLDLGHAVLVGLVAGLALARTGGVVAHRQALIVQHLVAEEAVGLPLGGAVRQRDAQRLVDRVQDLIEGRFCR